MKMCLHTPVWYEHATVNCSPNEMIESIFSAQPQQLYRFRATNLMFGSQYNLTIRGVNTNDEKIEGPESAISFATPTCWEIHDFNTSLCREQIYICNWKIAPTTTSWILIHFSFSAPQQLQNLTSTHALAAKGVYNINVTWEQISPELQPIYYTVSILPHYSEMYTPDDAKQSYDVVSLNTTGVSSYLCSQHSIRLNAQLIN